MNSINDCAHWTWRKYALRSIHETRSLKHSISLYCCELLFDQNNTSFSRVAFSENILGLCALWPTSTGLCSLCTLVSIVINVSIRFYVSTLWLSHSFGVFRGRMKAFYSLYDMTFRSGDHFMFNVYCIIMQDVFSSWSLSFNR